MKEGVFKNIYSDNYICLSCNARFSLKKTSNKICPFCKSKSIKKDYIRVN